MSNGIYLQIPAKVANFIWHDTSQPITWHTLRLLIGFKYEPIGDTNIVVIQSYNMWAVPVGRSEGFPRTGYFIPGRDGTGAWKISGVVRVTARVFLLVF